LSIDESLLLSLKELPGGEPTQRAVPILQAIENRTAKLVAQSRHANTRFSAGKRTPTEALGDEHAASVAPTIQDLERYAARWANLVPPDPGSRAALAFLIGEKYFFTYHAIPSLRHALSLDEAAVKQIYAEYYRQSLDLIYAVEISRRERWRWAWADLANRLDNLPPFWFAFALTLTETVGASILGLPIALAGVGPIAGVIQLVLLGLVNLVTIAAISEAVVRNGDVRYGNTFFGRVVTDYLGSVGAWILTPVFIVFTFVVLMVYFIGMSTTLEGVTGISAAIWAGLMLLVELYFVRRQTLNATITTSIIIGAINIGLILVLSALALPHITPANLSYVNFPILNGKSFDASVLGLIFGVILTAYFGHTSTVTCAQVVLRRDPSGRSLIWGTVSAMSVAMVLYSVFVIAVNGSIAPAILSAQTGTVIKPLAATAGSIVNVFGVIYVILGIGMASIQFSLALFNQVREWLPRRARATQVERGGWVKWIYQIAASREGRFWLSASPILLAFAVIEWQLLNRQESFTASLSFIGALAVPLVAGIFPILMLAVSRRKGDYVPGIVFRWLGNPMVILVMYLLFLASLFAHGLFIWQDPLQRACALAMGILMLGLVVILVRQQVFAPRAIVELRVAHNSPARASFHVTANGMPSTADVRLGYADSVSEIQSTAGADALFDKLCSATFHLASQPVRELKVWVHQVTAEGESKGVSACVAVQSGTESVERDLPSNGQTLFPMDNGTYRVTIDFNQPISSGAKS